MAILLEIEQDSPFQRRLWKFEKIGTLFLMVFFVAAFTGLLGSGPISYKKNIQGNFKIEYPYLTRFSHPETIKLEFSKTNQDTINLIISRSYLENVKIERIIPQPVAESLYKDYILFSFLSAEVKNEEIFFNVQFRSGGLYEGEWGLKGENTLKVKQFVYP